MIIKMKYHRSHHIEEKVEVHIQGIITEDMILVQGHILEREIHQNINIQITKMIKNIVIITIIEGIDIVKGIIEIILVERSRNRYKDEEEESMRRHLLKTNSINAFLQGKSSNIFYDDNYLPLSSNPYKYLGKPGLEDNNISLDKIDEIPISSSNVSKKEVELYVINLPSDLAEDQIMELLNAALVSIEANDKIGDPIVKVTKGKNGNYFILEFRTANECKNTMNLNGMKILNRTLK